MKKILLSVALLATTFASATAQVEYKPQAGHVTADFSLFANGIFNQTTSPIKLGDREGSNAGLLKGRYFVNESLALRASLGLASGSTTTKDSNLNTEDVKKSNEFTLGFGAEHHFSVPTASLLTSEQKFSLDLSPHHTRTSLPVVQLPRRLPRASLSVVTFSSGLTTTSLVTFI